MEGQLLSPLCVLHAAEHLSHLLGLAFHLHDALRELEALRWQQHPTRHDAHRLAERPSRLGFPVRPTSDRRQADSALID